MITDRTASHLDQVSSLILQEQENLKKQKMAKKFVYKAEKLLLDYGPTIYVAVSWKARYRKLPCGVINTPDVEFFTPAGEQIMVNITAEVVGRDNDEYGNLKTVGISFRDKGTESQFTVSLGKDEKITPETLPALKDSQNGVLILDHIEADYRRRNLERHEEPEDGDHR